MVVPRCTSRDQLVPLGRRFNVAAVPGAGRRPSRRAPSSADTRLPRFEAVSRPYRLIAGSHFGRVKSAVVWLSAVIWSAAAAVGDGPKSYVTGNLRVETDARVASQLSCRPRSRLNDRFAIGKMPKSHVSDGAGPTSEGSFGAQEVIVREK